MSKFKGFTLVELLIATAIFAVVMLTIYSAFQAGVFSYRNIEETINMYQIATQILERINLDLRNAFVYSIDESKFAGDKNSVGFLALVDTFLEDNVVQDYAFVAYKLEGGKLLRLCRRNTDSLDIQSETPWEEMVSHAAGIIFSYGYQAEGKSELQWKDFWAKEDALEKEGKTLPVSVKVKLTLKNKNTYEFERTIFLPLPQ